MSQISLNMKRPIPTRDRLPCQGARVGDMHMSLIYTCELSGANPFDYLNQLQLNATNVAQQPERWMPWNYRDSVTTTSDAA